MFFAWIAAALLSLTTVRAGASGWSGEAPALAVPARALGDPFAFHFQIESAAKNRPGDPSRAELPAIAAQMAHLFEPQDSVAALTLLGFLEGSSSATSEAVFRSFASRLGGGEPNNPTADAAYLWFSEGIHFGAVQPKPRLAGPAFREALLRWSPSLHRAFYMLELEAHFRETAGLIRELSAKELSGGVPDVVRNALETAIDSVDANRVASSILDRIAWATLDLVDATLDREAEWSTSLYEGSLLPLAPLLRRLTISEDPGVRVIARRTLDRMLAAEASPGGRARFRPCGKLLARIGE